MQLVIVERNFEEPQLFEELQALEAAKHWCLETHEVTFVKTYFSLDRKRMFCVYRAPDADAVRSAQRQAGMPFDTVIAVTEHVAE